MGYAERPGNRPLRALTIMQTRHTRKLVSLSLGLTVLACVWYFLAPVALGGSTSYVVTDGVSMEPHFHTGDLAVVRRQSSYRVGEIVAYDSKMFHTVVLHRIIARDGSRYVFKGDNNNFVDFEHPAASQLIGALWLHVPGLGGKLQSVRSPALIALLITVGVLLLSGVAFTHRRRRRRRQKRAEADGVHRQLRLPQGSSEHVVGVLSWGLVAMLPLVGLALLAFTRPTTTSVPYSVPYQQSGAFSYSADAPPGPAYSNGRAATGDPLFTHLIKSADVSFEYLFHAAAQHSIQGKAWMDAALASSSGWHTTIALGSPTYFHGDRARVSADLNLASLLALLHRVASTTAVNGSYTLALVPHVSTSGSIGAVHLHITYSPQLHFSFGELEVQPTLGASTTPLGKPLPSPFAPTESGSLVGRHAQSLKLSLGFASPSVTAARSIALGGIVVILGVLLATVAFVRPRRRSEGVAIDARYRGLIVQVARVWQLPGAAVIDVDDMESLVRIAEHYDRSILHESADGGDAFWVTDESGQFRYSVGMPGSIEVAQGEHEHAAAIWQGTADVAYAEPVTAVEQAAEYVAPAADTAHQVEAQHEQAAVDDGFPIEVEYAEPVSNDGYVAAPEYAEPTLDNGYVSASEYVQPAVGYVEPVSEYGHVAAPAGYAAAQQPAPAGVYTAQVQPVLDPAYEAQASSAQAEAGVVALAPVELSAQGRPDLLVREVYADELELGGVISAFGTEAPANGSLPVEAASAGDDVGDALIQGWHAAYEVAQAGRGPVVVKS